MVQAQGYGLQTMTVFSLAFGFPRQSTLVDSGLSFSSEFDICREQFEVNQPHRN
jgi:hypothetical protein